MRHLLDTHCLLWFLQGAPELPDGVADRIEAPGSINRVSAASIWEMAIKIALGKLRVPYSLDQELPGILEDNGFVLLPLDFPHLQRVTQLPFHHRDPFDRLLAAQCQVEDLTILSRDASFDAYDVPRFWG